MRFAIAATAVLCLLSLPHVAQAGESFPYTAYVSARQTSVQSGPGRQFYATDQLDWGTKVEVHRLDPGGWCAVRPPEGSFSWVAAKHLEVTDDPSLAKVISDDTVTYVGSRLGHDRDVRYIELSHGELVEVLGKSVAPQGSDGDAQSWLKIAPPAGEFRWVRLADLAKTPPDAPVDLLSSVPATLENVSDPEDVPVPATVPSRVSVQPEQELAGPTVGVTTSNVDDEQENDTTSTKDAASSGWKLQRIDRDARDSAKKAAPIRTVQALSREDQVIAPHHLPTGAQDPPQSVKTTFDQSAELASIDQLLPTDDKLVAEELATLSLRLSLRVAGDTANWDLEELRRRTQAIADQDVSLEQRNEALELLARIHEFARFQQRYEEVHGPVPQSTSPARMTALSEPGRLPVQPSSRRKTEASQAAMAPMKLNAAGGTRADQPFGSGLQSDLDSDDDSDEGDQRSLSDDVQYAGRGWLMPVVSGRQEVPRYALTNRNGNVVQFVTPAPGLNLHRYLRQEVGIQGQRGFMPKLQKPHLTAQRVVVLDRHRR